MPFKTLFFCLLLFYQQICLFFGPPQDEMKMRKRKKREPPPRPKPTFSKEQVRTCILHEFVGGLTATQCRENLLTYWARIEKHERNLFLIKI